MEEWWFTLDNSPPKIDGTKHPREPNSAVHRLPRVGLFGKEIIPFSAVQRTTRSSTSPFKSSISDKIKLKISSIGCSN